MQIETKRPPMYTIVAILVMVGIAAVGLGVPVQTVLFVAAIAACPLMMLLMGHGGHGRHDRDDSWSL